ncbi:MAG: hypothetical protein Q8Q02_17300 [Nocardioides sp.]|nr:hypothetical protein [Nocardioides sp.]
MRGIVTIDRQPDSDQIAVWVTSRADPSKTTHVNAVVIDAADDPDAVRKVRSLTRASVVLVTDGTDLPDLPIEGDPLTVADIEDLVAETDRTQAAILDAIADYKRRTRSKNLVEPVFPMPPTPADFRPEANTPPARALATANYAGRAWTRWLQTDEERRRRTTHPRTGETPWMMPDAMNSPALEPFPAEFAGRLHEQALV